MIRTKFSSYVRLDDDFSELQIIGEWSGREEDSPHRIDLTLDTSSNQYAVQEYFRGSFRTSGFINRELAIAKFEKLTKDKA